MPLLAAFERDPAIRRRWGALVRVAGPAALVPLLSALESRYASVRQSAAEGLHELGASAIPALLAVSHERIPTNLPPFLESWANRSRQKRWSRSWSEPAIRIPL